jgi:peptide-methionine (S)-S-oxide reductase
MWTSARRRTQEVGADRALPGRDSYSYALARQHAVLGTPLLPPFPEGVVRLYLGMGCFWGAEKRLWKLPGVFTTAVGYQGGITAHPTYEEVCTGLTGHSEIAMVAYDPANLPTLEVLRLFWENHDPTQGMRQGNDIGTQYRSAIYWTTAEQEDLARRSGAAYDQTLQAQGFDPITTELRPAEDADDVVRPFYYAESYHQQYLAPSKNPRGYDCHAHTGILLPDLM